MSMFLAAMLLATPIPPPPDADAYAPLPDEARRPTCVMPFDDANTPPPPEEAWGASERLPTCLDESAPYAEAWAMEAPFPPPLNDPSELMKQISIDVMRSLANAWRDCTTHEARSMALRSREPAATIVTAALAMCAAEYRAMDWSVRNVGEMMGGGSDAGLNVAPRHREDWRGSLLAVVIKTRQ
jgi:hypothetical protein